MNPARIVITGAASGIGAAVLRLARERGMHPFGVDLTPGGPRPVVDTSSGVGLTVLFDNAAGHDTYQPHPLHEQFIARNKDLWTRVQVYDVVAGGA